MKRIILLFAMFAAYSFAINADSAGDAGSGANRQADSEHSKGSPATNPQIHDHCACPADCPCRSQQQAPCDCGCEQCGHE